MTHPPLLRTLVFTDLDGTLLDHDDYDWGPAAPVLAVLHERAIPLVIASSKTRAEIESWRARLAIADPFISENGGALWVPAIGAPGPLPDAEDEGPYRRVTFGTPYAEIRTALRAIESAMGVALRGFGDMDAAEIAALTGLPAAEAAHAAAREYDEPFVIERPLSAAESERLAALVMSHGLRLTRGGRFHHLTGANDKGRAARRLIDAWETLGPVRTIGLGDGPNDLELLSECDQAVIVARPDGSHAPELAATLRGALRTRASGSRGFAEGLGALLAREDGGGPG